uniref:Uncharacterized protein n=1 Tax=Arundo donax TaxID=35708 RepID=A0A0A9EKA3_ARUDO
MSTDTAVDMMSDDCRYRPSMRYSLAPYACPHSVSSAPLRPVTKA